MVVHVATTDPPARVVLTPVARQLLQALSTATTILLLLLGAWLLVRRAAGQLQQPLGPGALAWVAVTLSGAMSLARTLWYCAREHHQPWRTGAWLQWAAPTLVILLIAVALSIQGTGNLFLTCFWTVLVVVEGAWWWFAGRAARMTRSPPSREALERATVGSTSERSSATDALESHLAEQADVEQQLAEDVSQQITRVRAEEEDDTVTGLLRARFGPRQRSHSLHVAFCPPMLRRPDVTYIQLSGSRTRIKAAEVQPFGIRFDLRLAAASENPLVVLLHFEARCGKPEVAGLGGNPA